MSDPLHGELTCPVEFYNFCNRRFETLERNLESLSLMVSQHLARDELRVVRFEKVEEDVSDLKALVRTQIAKAEGARTVRTTSRQRVRWYVTTAIALAAMVTGSIAALRSPEPASRADRKAAAAPASSAAPAR